MSSQSTYDLDGQEQMERRHQQAARNEARRYQHQQDMELFYLEMRRGYYRLPLTATIPAPALPWDGVKNSQILPIA